MASETETAKPEARYTEEMRQTLVRAQAGDASALPQLRQLLDGRPELWREFGDLARHARESMVALAAGKSLLARESVHRRMDELQAELAGPSPSPLEKLLVERVVVCWAQAYLADLDALAKDRAGTQQASFAQRRQSAAQARYLAAVKQLAVVRKLCKSAPTPLQLLKFPVDETGGDAVGGRPRPTSPQPAAAAAN
jgi:hypothetical protein